LPHSAWVYEGTAIAAMKLMREDDLQLLWLPMAHAFGKVLVTAQLACGFATAIDGRVDKIVDNLAVVKPTVMGAAPRIFEKVHARIVTTQQAQGGLRARLFAAAFTVGLEVDRRRRAGRSVPLPMSLLYGLFDRLVFSKVREVFGGRIRLFISGAAPLNRDIGEWFHAAGLLILEGYGLTETAAGACVNRPDHYKLGTVGLPFEGTSVRINDDDGEIQIRGACVMDGYHNLPDKRRRRSPTTAGCAPATWAQSMPTGSSPSPAGSRRSSRPPAGNTSPRRRSRRSSWRCVPMPASSWCSGRPATSAWR